MATPASRDPRRAGLTAAGRLVLTGAPLEVSSALITEGVMSGCLVAQAAGSSMTTVLGHIPTYLIGSILYGLAFAVAFYGYAKFRPTDTGKRLFGPQDPFEPRLVFLGFFLLTYTTSIDNVDTPWLIGFFAALCMAMSTQYLLPALADELALSLKPVWYFAECFLFVLTGCVIRPASESRSSALCGQATHYQRIERVNRPHYSQLRLAHRWTSLGGSSLCWLLASSHACAVTSSSASLGRRR